MPANPIPPTLSLQLSFILLGQKKLNSDTDPEHLGILYEAFRHFCPSLPVRIWVQERFQADDGVPRIVRDDEDMKQVGRDIARRRRAWRNEQKQHWKEVEESGSWIFRLTPEHVEKEEEFGVLGPWKHGDGLLTDREKKALGSQVWACPFVLQRLGVAGIGVTGTRSLECEVELLMKALRGLGTFEHPKFGSLFKVVVGSRGWGVVGFSVGREDGDGRAWLGRSAGESEKKGKVVEEGWHEATVSGLLILLSGFEREMLGLLSATLLATYWPLSNFLTREAVEELRQQKRRLWKEIDQGGKGSGRKKRWEDVQGKWVEELQWEDEATIERERVFGERKMWWGELSNMLSTSEGGEGTGVGGLVWGIKEMEEKGQRVVVSFTLNGTSYEGKNGDDKEDEVDLHDSQRHSQPSSLQTASPPTTPAKKQAYPNITTITLPFPIHTSKHEGLTAEPLLAHIKLLSQIILFVHEHPPDFIMENLKRVRESSSLLDEFPSTTLGALTRMLGVAESEYNTLISFPSVPRDSEAGQRGSHGVFGKFLSFVEEDVVKGMGFTGEFVETYEKAGGFEVPRRMKVYAVMEGTGRAIMRRVQRGRGKRLVDVEKWIEGLSKGCDHQEDGEEVDETF